MKSNDERRPRLLASILRHLRGQFLGAIALFVALGGTSYAALELPAGSVGNRQIKNHVITPIKFDKSTIAGYVRDYAQISPQGVIVAARPQATLVGWRSTGPNLGGIIQWDQPIPSSCFALATTEAVPNANYVSAQVASGGAKADGQVSIELASQASTQDVATAPVNVAVLCPEP
jgi:hypothetical protein